jgi:hypothetical protein
MIRGSPALEAASARRAVRRSARMKRRLQTRLGRGRHGSGALLRRKEPLQVAAQLRHTARRQGAAVKVAAQPLAPTDATKS